VLKLARLHASCSEESASFYRRTGSRLIQDYDTPLQRLMHRTTMGGAVPV
jgi:hypothetical protein